MNELIKIRNAFEAAMSKAEFELIGGCVARIYNVYQEFQHLDPILLNNKEIRAIHEIIEINEDTQYIKRCSLALDL